jgi:prepilin-type processing-associated H-X9-DG protein
MGQMKQLTLGISLFAPDRGDTFPPSAWGSSTFNRALSWETFIYGYIGGSQSVKPNVANAGKYALDPFDAALLGDPIGLPIMTCPADTFPKVGWMHVAGDAGLPLQFAPRTYAMNSAGVAYSTDIQVDPQGGVYPLPDLSQPNRHGVGIYWLGKGIPDPEAKGYPVSVVRDPAGTILLVENPQSQGDMGDQWGCCSCGPWCTIPTWSDLFQIDPNAPTDTQSLTASAPTYSEGTLLYKAHNNRFNYAFHDGHVESLQYTDTVGSGTLQKPAGMWSVKAGD